MTDLWSVTRFFAALDAIGLSIILRNYFALH